MDIKSNTGLLFENNKKDDDKHPDMRGQVNINGKDYSVAAWSRKSKNGNEYIYLSFGDFQPYEKPQDKASQKEADKEETTDDLPF